MKIRLIAATNGYVEDAQQSVMLWYNNYEEYDLAGSLISLASQLADLYRSEVLRDTHYEPGLPPFGERPTATNRYYPSGDRLLFEPFDPSEFAEYIRKLPSQTINAMGVMEDYGYWDFVSFYRARRIPMSETLLVTENFERIIAASVPVDDSFLPEERERMLRFVKDNQYQIASNESWNRASICYDKKHVPINTPERLGFK